VPRWPLAALVVLALAVPAASAAREPCWQGVIRDWYDNGKLDRAWSCNCLREAIDRLPQDTMMYSDASAVMQAAEKRACAVSVTRAATVPPKHSHTNWPARISGIVLMAVAFALLIWRRRQRATSRGARRARDRE
jgi:hypothetical protein